MIVDDHQPFREALAQLLSLQEVVELVGQAGDGGEAVLAAKRLQPDLVIMDIQLPRMNGLDAARAIKCQHDRTEVILYTGNDPRPYRIHADKLAVAVLAKEDLFSELVPLIHRFATDLQPPEGDGPALPGDE